MTEDSPPYGLTQDQLDCCALLHIRQYCAGLTARMSLDPEAAWEISYSRHGYHVTINGKAASGKYGVPKLSDAIIAAIRFAKVNIEGQK